MQHGRGRAQLGDAPGVQHRDTVGYLSRDPEVVGDHQEAAPDLVAQRAEQREHLGLHHDVQRRGRLIGDHQRRAPRDRHRDHDALPQPAGQLVREAGHPPGGVRDAHRAQQADRLVLRARCLDDLPADPHRRVQRGHGVLEHRAEMLAADGPAQPGRSVQHVLSAHGDGAGRDRGRLTRQQAQQRHAEHALAGPGLTDQAEDLPAPDLQADAADRLDVQRAPAERDGQVLDPGDRLHRVRLAGRRVQGGHQGLRASGPVTGWAAAGGGRPGPGSRACRR